MLYCIDPSADEPIMLINKHIGFDEKDGQGIDGSLFMGELLMLDGMGKKRIQVWINSPGGVVLDGYNIFCAMLKTKTKVDTYCMGCAASIAGVIFQGGRRRIMADYGWLMYHMPFGGDDKSISTIADSLITMVAKRTSKTEDFVKQMLKRETFIDAEEAMRIGFCDDIEQSEDLNKKRVQETNDIRGRWAQSDKILNSAISSLNSLFPVKIKNHDMNLKLITNLLDLNVDASEDSIVAGIKKIQDRLAKADEEMDKVKSKAEEDKKAWDKKVKELEDEMAEKKAEYDKLKAKHDKMKEEKEEEDKARAKKEEDKKDEDCKNMIENFQKIGRLDKGDEIKNQWMAIAKTTGLEATKAAIEKLPLNKKEPKEVKNLGTTGPAKDGDLTNGVLVAMQKIRSKFDIN